MTEKPQPGSVTQFLRNFVQWYFVLSPIGGPTIFTVRQCINLHKLLVVPVYVYILHTHGGLSFEQTYSPAAALLLVLHGIYGILWVYKDIFFPDPSWQTPMSPLGFLFVFSWPLASYYLPMQCLVSPSSLLCPLPAFASGNEPWQLALGAGLYTVGVIYMFGADVQKYVQLSLERPRALITTGLFAHSRNPNYFGEVLIYSGYAVLSGNHTCLPAFALVWLILFVPNIMAKEASMSRHKGWDAWVARTGLIVPWIPAVFADFATQGLSKLPAVSGDKKKA